MNNIFGRQPILVTTAIAAVINLVAYYYHWTGDAVSLMNVAAAAVVAVVANLAVTPVGDARLDNGTAVNSGKSVVVAKKA